MNVPFYCNRSTYGAIVPFVYMGNRNIFSYRQYNSILSMCYLSLVSQVVISLYIMP